MEQQQQQQESQQHQNSQQQQQQHQQQHQHHHTTTNTTTTTTNSNNNNNNNNNQGCESKTESCFFRSVLVGFSKPETVFLFVVFSAAEQNQTGKPTRFLSVSFGCFVPSPLR